MAARQNIRGKGEKSRLGKGKRLAHRTFFALVLKDSARDSVCTKVGAIFRSNRRLRASVVDHATDAENVPCGNSGDRPQAPLAKNDQQEQHHLPTRHTKPGKRLQNHSTELDNPTINDASTPVQEHGQQLTPRQDKHASHEGHTHQIHHHVRHRHPYARRVQLRRSRLMVDPIRNRGLLQGDAPPDAAFLRPSRGGGERQHPKIIITCTHFKVGGS